jgi:hypothetical protein
VGQVEPSSWNQSIATDGWAFAFISLVNKLEPASGRYQRIPPSRFAKR